MPLIYTTTDAIARRLRGRLKLTTTMSPSMAPSTNTQQVVDPLLIEDVGAQVEDEVNMILGQIYELPLKNQHPILAGIVEGLVIAEIMLTHFQGSQVPEMGGDPNYGAIMYKKSRDRLGMLCAGHNINIPNVTPQMSAPGVATPQPIVLQGEILKVEPPDTISKNYTFVGKSNFRPTNENYSEWGITWNTDRARGSQKPLWD